MEFESRIRLSLIRWALFGGVGALLVASYLTFRLAPPHRSQAKEVGLKIIVVPLGNPTHRTLRIVEDELVRTYSGIIVVMPEKAMPGQAYYRPRKRYRPERLTSYLRGFPGQKVLGVTDYDISTTVHGFADYGIMGLGDLDGRLAVVSSFRSHDRVGQVAVHEIGHTLGLPHCPNVYCVMVDAKGKGFDSKSKGKFCAMCVKRIRKWLR